MCLCHTSFSHFLLVLVYSSVICKRLFLSHLDCTDFSHIPLCMSSSVSHRGSTFLCMLYNVCIVYYNGLSLLTSLSFLKMKKRSNSHGSPESSESRYETKTNIFPNSAAVMWLHMFLFIYAQQITHAKVLEMPLG